MQEVLEDEPKNVLFAMIRQLKVGMDLHRITFPTFVLEPRSMLERITDFMSHQDLLFSYDSRWRECGHAGQQRGANTHPVPSPLHAPPNANAPPPSPENSVPKQTDPFLRFLSVVRYFLSGWHIKPKVRRREPRTRVGR